MNAGPLRQSWRGGGVPRLRNSRSSLQRLASAQGGGLFVALVLLSLYFSLSTGSFFTRSNILVVLEQISVLGIVAVPGAMLLVSGNLDLSVGSVAGLSAAVFGEFDKIFGWPVWLAALGALAVGAAWGTMNGILISYLGFSPVIVTLGGFAGAAGLAQTITSDSTRSAFGTGFDFLGNGTLVGDPVMVLIFFAVFLIGVFVWYETSTGRHLIAIGANKSAATALGVASRRLPCVIYILSGTAAALGGLIVTAQLDGASVQIGVGLELQVLTAILLGGVAFNGGRGSLWGTLAGILFIGVLDDGLILINVGPYVADLAVGAALVVAAALDVLYQRLERVPVPESAEAEALETDKPAASAAGPPAGPILNSPAAAGPAADGPPAGGPAANGSPARAGQPSAARQRPPGARAGGLGHHQAVRAGGRAAGCFARPGPRRGTGAGRRQRSREEHPDLNHLRGGQARLRGNPAGRQAVGRGRRAHHPGGRGRDRVPEPGPGAHAQHRREHVPGPGAARAGQAGLGRAPDRQAADAPRGGNRVRRLGLRMPPVASKAGALSGGQRQAVAVARAVLWGSRVVIMDEPAAALGVQQTEAVLALIGRLKAEGVATLLVSHNMEHVLRVADRVAVFRLGRKIADLDQREQPVTGMHLVGLITGATSAST